MDFYHSYLRYITQNWPVWWQHRLGLALSQMIGLVVIGIAFVFSLSEIYSPTFSDMYTPARQFRDYRLAVILDKIPFKKLTDEDFLSTQEKLSKMNNKQIFELQEEIKQFEAQLKDASVSDKDKEAILNKYNESMKLLALSYAYVSFFEKEGLFIFSVMSFLVVFCVFYWLHEVGHTIRIPYGTKTNACPSVFYMYLILVTFGVTAFLPSFLYLILNQNESVTFILVHFASSEPWMAFIVYYMVALFIVLAFFKISHSFSFTDAVLSLAYTVLLGIAIIVFGGGILDIDSFRVTSFIFFIYVIILCITYNFRAIKTTPLYMLAVGISFYGSIFVFRLSYVFFDELMLTNGSHVRELSFLAGMFLVLLLFLLNSFCINRSASKPQ